MISSSCENELAAKQQTKNRTKFFIAFHFGQYTKRLNKEDKQICSLGKDVLTEKGIFFVAINNSKKS